MAMGAIALQDKRSLASQVGKHLTLRYGKRTHYSPTLVKAAMRRLQYPDIWDCWALSLFSSPGDFASYHDALGQVCDYGSMNSDMLSAVHSHSLLDFVSGDWSIADHVSNLDSGISDGGGSH
jgi:hypothetical protein